MRVHIFNSRRFARVNRRVEANHLISRFVLATKMAVDLDPDALDVQREFARDDCERAYGQFDGWAGSREALVELLAHVRAASRLISVEPDPDASALLRPAWDAIVEAQPGLYHEWFLFYYTHPDGI